MSLNAEPLHTAFMELRHSLRNYLRRRLPEPDVAEDLLQDIFVKALHARQSGRHIHNLAGWFYATARTTLADYLRSTKNGTTSLNDNIPVEETQDLQLHADLSNCLRPFINQLPPVYRDTLIATEFQHTPMRTLADADNISVSAVKSRALRARKMLKESVLKCCQVEMENGIVSHYQKNPTEPCSHC